VSPLLDHLIRPLQERGWDRQTEVPVSTNSPNPEIAGSRALAASSTIRPRYRTVSRSMNTISPSSLRSGDRYERVIKLLRVCYALKLKLHSRPLGCASAGAARR